ncbi:MAG: hypothetical protein RL095_2239 [Verrucomicrobiota bacterium]|jgi:endonuclease/exonuclease/phosphatase (EEP) superfamily protein YafD
MKTSLVIVLPALSVFLLGLITESHWAHAVKPLLPFALLGSLAAGLCRRWSDLGLSLMLILGGFTLFSCRTLPQAERACGEGRSLSVFAANLYIGNTDMEALLEHLRQTRPTLIVLTEFGFDQQEALAELNQSHPYGFQEPRNNPFGIAVFSRLPGRFQLLPDAEIHPSIYGEIQDGAHSLRLLATHPFPPLGESGRRARDRQLERLAESLGRSATGSLPPLIVAGDLNCVPWNAPLTDFAGKLDLRGTSGRYFHGGSFPSWAGPFGLTLDHILVAPAFRLKDFRRGPRIGSDHLPIQAELEW